LTPETTYLVMWKNILPHVHGWMIFMDEIVDDKWQQMNFFMNVGNKCFFVKIEQKKQDRKNLCWFILKNPSHEMFKSYFNYYFIFLNTKHIYSSFVASKPYRVWN
jgi:hypothetical protein